MEKPADQKIQQHRKLTITQIIARTLFICIGVMLEAAALEIFLVPNKIIDGGVVGISIMLSHISGLKLGLFLFVLNLPFFFIGYKQMGKTFTVTSIGAVTLLSIMTTLFTPIPRFTDDLLLASVFGGVILGIGVGLVIRYGGSSDGTEILAVLFNEKKKNAVFRWRSGDVRQYFHSWQRRIRFRLELCMYSLIAYFIAFKMIDITSEGLESSKAVWIISNEHEKIGNALNVRLGRGVTYLNGEGAYSRHEKKKNVSLQSSQGLKKRN
ncbi:YitT family protein [Terrilactibacillus sp. S3-3]|nr:YitT family protein [Terrilactibacillus sp. S3-3]